MNHDSIRVYIMGNFNKKDVFKIHTSNRTYFIENKENYCSSRAWYLYITLDSIPKDGDLLPILIEKKIGSKFYDVKLRVYYESDRSYLILWKDYRQSKKFPFIAMWKKSILNFPTINSEIWSNEYNLKFVPKCEKRNSDYSYFFEHIYEYQ